MYRGQYVADQTEGRGIYIFNSDPRKDQNSLYYVGNFKQGVATGLGKLTFKNGTVYNGQFI